ncbi:MAG TPA: hypothetical protein ENH41_01220 [Candidatus Omnitrophica bacterium]|nr:hypothetical protein [Candidatus Omnitrophota bacterium]
MKKIIFINLRILFIFLMSSSLAFAQATGPASVYQVTVTKFELYNGTSWVTASSGNSTVMDIASVDIGAVVGNLFSGLSVPDGSYTQVRVTISDTFTISGNDGVGNYTTAATGGNPVGSVLTAIAANEAECTISLPVAQGDPNPNNLPTPLTVTGGRPSHRITVNFNVSNGIQNQGGVLYPNNPVVTMTMTAI